MGAFFTSRFLDTPGFSTSVVARGQRYERLKNNGLVVNDKTFAVPVTHPDEDQPPADLIIVALKNMASQHR